MAPSFPRHVVGSPILLAVNTGAEGSTSVTEGTTV